MRLSTNSDIQFTVVIGNACETNTLTISTKPMINYWLRTPPAILADRMTVNQKYSFCPYECTLQQFIAATKQYVPYPIDVFNTWNPYTA